MILDTAPRTTYSYAGPHCKELVVDTVVESTAKVCVLAWFYEVITQA